jgi:hypothetical protein
MMRSRGIRLDEAISKEEVEEVQRHLWMQSSRSTDLKVENLWVDNRCLLLSSMVSESCPYGLWIWCGFGRVAASIPFVPPGDSESNCWEYFRDSISFRYLILTIN